MAGNLGFPSPMGVAGGGGYPYGAGMDSGIAGGQWVGGDDRSAGTWMSNPLPLTPQNLPHIGVGSSYDQGLGYGGGTPAAGPINFDNMVGMGVTPMPVESANNPNNVGGWSSPPGYNYGSGMDYGLGSYGFGSNGGGMGFGYGFQSQPAATDFGLFGGGGSWVGGDDRSAGTWVPSTAPTPDWGRGDPGFGGGDIQTGLLAGSYDPAVLYGGGNDIYNMTASANNSLATFGAANNYAAAQNQASSDALSNYAALVAYNAAATGQAAFDRSAPGQIAGYNPFSTQYQAY